MPLRFVNPNYHVILIHYPLGVFMLGLLLEVFSFLWPRSSARAAGRWMLLIGGLATLPAATSGIYALSDVANHQGMTPLRYQFLRWHTLLQSFATLIAVLTVVFALGASNHARRVARVPILAILLLVGGLLVVGAWHGGETVYTQQTSVQPLKDGVGEDSAAKLSKKHGYKLLVYLTGEPVQLHMIMAGVTFALALASLGLSIRKITTLYPEYPSTLLVNDPPADTHVSSGEAPLIATTPSAVEPSVGEAVPPQDSVLEIVPATRFWLVAALLALGTVAGGYWVWAEGATQPTLSGFWDDIMMGDKHLAWTRASLHVWIGGGLVVFTLILAALSRWASQNKPVLTLFAAILVFFIAAQTWLGVLLQFEGSEGPVYRWASPSKSTTTAMVEPLAK